jgi:hypothetical protein
VFHENLEIQLLLLPISDWIKDFFLVRLIARRELFVEIVNYVLKFLSFRVQVIWNFIFVVLLQDKYVIIYCSLPKGPATCGHECIFIQVGIDQITLTKLKASVQGVI